MYNNPFGLCGRMITRPEEITVNEIPMDGNVALFPKNDLSEIYLKRWNGNGSITTLKFAPCVDRVDSLPPTLKQAPNEPLNDVLERIASSLRNIETKVGEKNGRKRNADGSDNANE